jgi:SynChlorMet cassette radical SAM/SPASM protein ScmE
MTAEVMRTPRSVDVEITAECNLRCRYCSFFDNPGVPYASLPTEEWLRFFDELGRACVMSVRISGGEPCTRPDLPQLIDGIVRNRMRFSILSNGTLMTDELAAHLAQTGRCDSVQVSIDGSRAEIHDRLRGQGSFARAVAGLRALQRHGVSVTSRVTIHRHNVDDLEAVAAFLLDGLGLPGFSTNAASYLGSCCRSADQVMLDRDSREQAMTALDRVNARYPRRVQASAGPLAEARMWRTMMAAVAVKAPPTSGGGRLTGCGCTKDNLAVRADGSYLPCCMLPSVVLGRINRDPVEAVWRGSPILAAMRARSRIELDGFAECKGCAFVPYCTGNCPALAYRLVGEIDHPSPDACLRHFLESGGKVPGAALPARRTS